MTKKVQLLYAFVYCCLVFGIVFLIKDIIKIPAPFDWLVSVAASWLFLIPYYRLYTASKGYNPSLGFQAFGVREQIAAFAQMVVVPMAANFTFIFSVRIGVMLFVAAFGLLVLITLIGEEKNIKSHYTNINEKSPPIITLYYSRTKAWISLLFAFFLIIPMVLLIVIAIAKSGFHISMLVLAGFAGFFLYASLRYIRRLRHRKPVLTLSPLNISYNAPHRPSQVIDWSLIVQSGWFENNSNKQLLFKLKTRTEIKLDVRGLGLEPAALHELIGRYYADYVKKEDFPNYN